MYVMSNVLIGSATIGIDCAFEASDICEYSVTSICGSSTACDGWTWGAHAGQGPPVDHTYGAYVIFLSLLCSFFFFSPNY